MPDIVLSVLLCFADAPTECNRFDFEPEHPITMAQCTKTAPMSVAAIVSAIPGDWVIKEFRCRDRNELDA